MLYEDLVLIILEVIFTIGLYVLAGYAEKVISPKWRLCYVVPAVVCMFVIAVFGFEISMLGVYIGAVLLLAGFVKEEAKIRKTVSGIAGLGILLSVVICNLNPGYRAPDYVEDFNRAFEEMKAHYVLTEHKEINWDALYEKYLPRFEKADKNHDEIADFLAWSAFTAEFHDGHVAYAPTDEEVMKRALEQICGNDYGLSLMSLSGGDIVAVNVEPDSSIAKAGIHNGTVITAWDGKEIEEAVKESEENGVKLQGYASKENEAFYRALPAAGMGGDSITISFLDDSGKEQSVKADKMGTYKERWENSVEVINQGREISNLEWEEIDEDTALMRMRFMNYDAQGNFDQMEKDIRNRLVELKEAGVENLIFDLRSNGGGSGAYVKHIIKLIAPVGEHVYAYDGVLDMETLTYKKDAEKGTYEVGECETYQGEDLWGHGKIIILVNAATGSAGDHFTQLASAFPNVTVMGFTHSGCSAQGMHGVEFEYGTLTYSAVLLLNEDGTIFIDTDNSRDSTVPLDVQIPFDEEAVKVLFDQGEDYVLQYVMSYLKRNNN